MKAEPKLITHEQAQEIILRLGILITLLAPKMPGSNVRVDTGTLEQLASEVEAVAKAIGSNFRR